MAANVSVSALKVSDVPESVSNLSDHGAQVVDVGICQGTAWTYKYRGTRESTIFPLVLNKTYLNRVYILGFCPLRAARMGRGSGEACLELPPSLCPGAKATCGPHYIQGKFRKLFTFQTLKAVQSILVLSAEAECCCKCRHSSATRHD